MFTLEELEAVVNEWPQDSLPGRLAWDALRAKKVLGQYMDAEHEIRWAFMQVRDGTIAAPDLNNPADVKRIFIDPALAHLYPAADIATILSIILNACVQLGIGDTEHYQLSSQIVTRVVKTGEMKRG